MRPDLIVLFKALIDDDLGRTGCAKPFGVLNFAEKSAAEPLIIPVRPKIAPLGRFPDGLTKEVNRDRCGWA